jgi:uncharacterized protein YlaI
MEDASILSPDRQPDSAKAVTVQCYTTTCRNTATKTYILKRRKNTSKRLSVCDECYDRLVAAEEFALLLAEFRKDSVVRSNT